MRIKVGKFDSVIDLTNFGNPSGWRRFENNSVSLLQPSNLVSGAARNN